MILPELVVFSIYSLVSGQPEHFYYKPLINPTLEAYNFHNPVLPNFTVKIYYQGFTIIIKDDIQSYVAMELHGNLNSENDDNHEAQYYDVCEHYVINDTQIYWHYRNYQVTLKHGDYFYYWTHGTEPCGRVLRMYPGYFHVRNRTVHSKMV